MIAHSYCLEIFEKAFCPSFEEGRPRRSNNATLPQKIGAAGEVRRSPVPYRLPDRFKNRLDVLMNGSILKSNKFYSQSLQKRGTFGLVLCSELSEMRRTVQFDANVRTRRRKSRSDLPGRADSKVALHLFDRPGRPSSKEGQDRFSFHTHDLAADNGEIRDVNTTCGL